MSINEKIQKAQEYVSKLKGTVSDEQLRNDAANIFADNFEEYQAIWDALHSVPYEVELVDNVPAQVIEPPVFPEVAIPEDFNI